MPPKMFQRSADDMEPIAVGFGSCMASDRIMVDGVKVGFCYRDEPEGGSDNGWRFLAGDEDDAYMDDPENFAIYDTNTVANYDPDICAVLDAPVGSAFERDPSGGFVEIEDEAPED